LNSIKDIQLKDYQGSLKLRQEEGQKKILCAIRKKYLVLQPEELIRQSWIQYLITAHNLSPNLMQVEKQIIVLGKRRRFDLLLYDNDHNPSVLFEFKGFNVKVDNSTFEQIALYNLSLKIPKLIISNGIEHFGAVINFNTENYQLTEKIADILS